MPGSINLTYIKWTDAERTLVADAILGQLIARNDRPTPGAIRALWTPVQTNLANAGKLEATRIRVSSSPKDLDFVIARFNSGAVPNPTQSLLEAVAAYKAEFGANADPILDARKWRADQAWRMPTNVVVKHNPAPAPSSPAPAKTKLVVAIMGVHSRHWSRIDAQFPGIHIMWIDHYLSDRDLKSKVSGRNVVIYSLGVNGKMLSIGKSAAKQFFIATGHEGIERGLAFFKAKHEKESVPS